MKHPKAKLMVLEFAFCALGQLVFLLLGELKETLEP